MEFDFADYHRYTLELQNFGYFGNFRYQHELLKVEKYPKWKEFEESRRELSHIAHVLSCKCTSGELTWANSS